MRQTPHPQVQKHPPRVPTLRASWSPTEMNRTLTGRHTIELTLTLTATSSPGDPSVGIMEDQIDDLDITDMAIEVRTYRDKNAYWTPHSITANVDMTSHDIQQLIANMTQIIGEDDLISELEGEDAE